MGKAVRLCGTRLRSAVSADVKKRLLCQWPAGHGKEATRNKIGAQGGGDVESKRSHYQLVYSEKNVGEFKTSAAQGCLRTHQPGGDQPKVFYGTRCNSLNSLSRKQTDVWLTQPVPFLFDVKGLQKLACHSFSAAAQHLQSRKQQHTPCSAQEGVHADHL